MMTVTNSEGYQILKSGWVLDSDFQGVDPYPYENPQLQKFFFCKGGKLLPSMTYTVYGDVDMDDTVRPFSGYPEEWDDEAIVKAALEAQSKLSKEELRAIEDCWNMVPVVLPKEGLEYCEAYFSALKEINFFKMLKEEAETVYSFFPAEG